ncbi:MAG TPA: hypothetical protein VJ385_03920 [Fibrobacteria bacterium]|nr:hypothetical protein [Fibrobacteria bacterium]
MTWNKQGAIYLWMLACVPVLMGHGCGDPVCRVPDPETRSVDLTRLRPAGAYYRRLLSSYTLVVDPKDPSRATLTASDSGKVFVLHYRVAYAGTVNQQVNHEKY